MKVFKCIKKDEVYEIIHRKPINGVKVTFVWVNWIETKNSET